MQALVHKEGRHGPVAAPLCVVDLDLAPVDADVDDRQGDGDRPVGGRPAAEPDPHGRGKIDHAVEQQPSETLGFAADQPRGLQHEVGEETGQDELCEDDA